VRFDFQMTCWTCWLVHSNVAALYACGIVYRDLKPENLLLGTQVGCCLRSGMC
jgi:serine/threonine protein kinase